MKRGKPRFAICVNNTGCEDLDVWKVYRALPDKVASDEAHLRIVDESGEDYLYPADFFVLVEFSKPVEQRLLAAGAGAGA